MHGRPRKPPKPVDASASAAKAENLRFLQSQLLHNHRHHIYTREALDISSKLIEANPEVYTAWNYRKRAVLSLLGDASSEANAIFDAELRIVEVALRMNPKCYSAWYHRKWVLSRRDPGGIDFGHEFGLLDKLLRLDSRNFHGWNYRRFIAALKGNSKEEELNFMTDKIDTNFSNYSAWHNRSVLLSQTLLEKGQDMFTREKVLSEEFELVHQALFTDPDDQSGWFYYLWLLNQTTLLHNPLLLRSWPPDGSNFISSTNGLSDQDAFHKSYQLHTFLSRGNLPVVLCFDKPVKGVSSSTVDVESSFLKNEDLLWKPLSTNTSREANIWMTYIKVPELTINSSQSYLIEVRLGHTEGIVSSSGSPYKSAHHFGFTIDLRRDQLQEGRAEKENLVTWESTELLESLHLEIDELKISIHDEHGYSKWLVETLDKEIDLFRSLLDWKIGKLTLARLLVVYHKISKQKGHMEEIVELYDELIKVDPSHTKYYKDEKSVALMDQVTSSKSCLAQHCWKCKSCDSSRLQNCIILRLDNLSLTRIAFSDCLLWVQALDLSHNELRSIEGLEALQLLSYLNLRNNRINSFSALEPLKRMCSLQVLDLSHNEIGAHSIDTTRYLCASPFSHSSADDLKGVKYIANSHALDHWDAVLLFSDLHLTQLDIAGNAAATDGLRSLVVEVLPTLQWLDGSHV